MIKKTKTRQNKPPKKSNPLPKKKSNSTFPQVDVLSVLHD